MIATNSNLERVKRESVMPSFVYFSGYKSNRHLSIEEIIADFEVQAKTIDQFFNCGTDFDADWLVEAHLHCPNWVEKFFAQVPWWKIASTYSEAVEIVLDLIAEANNSKFCNYREGKIDQKRFRQLHHVDSSWRVLSDMQKGRDTLVVPAQFGSKYCGHSVEKFREGTMLEEFGLGTYGNGIMILTHPERLMHEDDLFIDCAGDEYDVSNDDVRFGHAPYFGFNDRQIMFSTDELSGAYDWCGSSSAFIPFGNK